MDAIEVTVRFDSQGKIIPLSFIWEMQTYRVDSIGRPWSGEDGNHILVLTPGNRAHHLLFMPEKGVWYRIRGGDVPTVPTV
jgi:hypothetical protein